MKRKLSYGEVAGNETKDIPEQELASLKQKAKVPVKPKRPQTAYFQFLADFRLKVKDVALKEGEKIPYLAARNWQQMTEDEKKPYKEKQADQWKKYEEDLAEYKRGVLQVEQTNLQEPVTNSVPKPPKTDLVEDTKDLKMEDVGEASNDGAKTTDFEQEKGPENSDKRQGMEESDVQCVCCGAILEEAYAIWFRNRYYCSKECLPEETSRGYRLGRIIKSGGNYLERKDRRQSWKFSAFAGAKEISGCPTPGCSGKGHINGKYSSHSSVFSCPIAQREFKKKTHRSDSVDSKESDSNKCPTPGCDGSGHVKGGMFSSHRSLYGCPRRNSFSKEFDLESRGSTDSLAALSSDAASKRGKGRRKGRGISECTNEDFKDVQNENSLDASMEELFDESASSEEFERLDLSGGRASPFVGAASDKRPRGKGRNKKRTNSKDSMWDVTEGEGNVLRLKRKSSNAKCEFPGCNGEGHVTGKFIKHRSLYGCPLAAKLSKEADGCPYPGCDGVGHVVPGLLTHESLSGCPMVAKVMVPSDIEVRCPIPSCDGRGHITGKFSTHRSATACPRAALLLEGKISYSSVEEEEIVRKLYEKNPESFAKSKNAVSSAITEEEILACEERFGDELHAEDFVTKPKKLSPSKREDPVLTMCKEIEILGAVNAEFEEKNLELKRKVEELEAECKSVTEDVLIVKTDEERLREEYQVCKRKILYSLSRVDLGIVGIKPNLKEFDSLIETLSSGFRKQKKNYETVLKEIRKAIACSDL